MIISQGYPLWFAVSSGDIGLVIGWSEADERGTRRPVVAWLGDGGDCWEVDSPEKIGGQYFVSETAAREYAP